MPIDGGCACGGLRFRITGALQNCGYCHCRLCQRTSGAPVMVFATVDLAAFEMTSGEPQKYRSTSFGERWFCASCGSQIAMRVDRESSPDTIDVSVVCLDAPETAPPRFHIWISSRLPWFDVRDDLTRFDRDREGDS